MPSDERRAIALEAIRPRIEAFHAALAVTSNQVRGLLAGSEDTADDRSAALGQFASGKMDMDRFASFSPKTAHIGKEAEPPIRAAQEVLASLLASGDDLFVLRIEPDKGFAHQIAIKLASIGRAFSAARVVDLARRGAYKQDKHAQTLEAFPFAQWNSSERAMSPALVVELAGNDFKPAAIVHFLDAKIKFVFKLEGDAPAAALAHVISPNVFVQQETGDAPLTAFSAFDGMAVAALLPKTAVSFVHDPSAGETGHDRFTSLTFPKEVRKRSIGGISPAQQAEDYALLESLAVAPALTGDAASDPAGKLSAWLLSQTNLSV